MHSDLSKYEQIKSKNQQMLKNALEAEKQLQQLRKEIIDMKKLKVKLMNQLRDETIKSKQDEQKRLREIALLKRDHLKKDSQIKSLEAEKRCKEIVLKRKQEQIQALRKFNATRVLSEKASGRASQTSSMTSYSDNNNTELSLTKTPINGRVKTPNFENSFSLKRKLTFQNKWQKIDDFVKKTFFKTHLKK